MQKLMFVLGGPWAAEKRSAIEGRDAGWMQEGRRWTLLPLPSSGLLMLRLMAGTAMLLHGAPKMLAPTGWMGPSQVPGFLQALAALAEFGGGLAWILGALTPLASLGVLATMLTGMALVHIPYGEPLFRLTVKGMAEGPSGTFAGLPRWFVQTDGAIGGGSGSSELALLFSAIAVVFLFLGPGRFAVDALWLRRRSPTKVSETPAQSTKC